MGLERKYLPAEVKAYDDKTLTITHFVSTEDKDRSGDVMRADGMHLDGKPMVLKQHGMDPDTGGEPIAKNLDIRVATNENGQKGIMVRTQYYDGTHLEPPDNTGRRLYEKAKNDFMPFWSVGFFVNKAVPARGGGREVLDWTMVEYSQVGVPDNVNAKNFDPEKDEHAFDLKFAAEEEPEETPEETPEKEEKSADPFEGMAVLALPEHVAVPQDLERPWWKLDIGEHKGLTCYRGEVLVPEDAVDEITSALEELNVIGLKSVTARVAMRLPADAMSTVFYAFMDELWVNARSDKDARNAVKELAKLIEPYAVDFVNAMIDMEAEQKAAKYEEYKAAHRAPAADPAPVVETKTPDTEPPEQKAVLQVAVPQRVQVDVKQLKTAIGETVRSGVRTVMGKLD